MIGVAIHREEKAPQLSNSSWALELNFHRNLGFLSEFVSSCLMFKILSTGDACMLGHGSYIVISNLYLVYP